MAKSLQTRELLSGRAGLRLRAGLPSFRNLVIFVAAFMLAYRFGMSFTHDLGAPFWFPDSVLLCALLLARPNTWWIYIIAGLPIRFFMFAPPDATWGFLLAVFLNDILKGVLSAWLLRQRWRLRAWFDSLREFVRYFLVAVVLSPALSAFAGAATRSVILGDAYWPTWKGWFFGDALASLVLTPLLICLTRDYRKLWGEKIVRYLEALAIFGGLTLSGFLAFHRSPGAVGYSPFLLYLPMPFLLWAAVRLGPLGASSALSLMSLMSIFGTLARGGPFSAAPIADSLIAIQLFVFVVSIPFMFLSIIIRQQRKTDVALRESERRFRYLVDTAPVMVWMCDIGLLGTFFNKPWLDFTGRSFVEQLGEGWLDSIHPEDRERRTNLYLCQTDAPSNCVFEFRLLRQDGAYRWLLNNAAPRYGPDGSLLGYIGSCIDITDRKDAEEKLRQVSAQLIHAQETERFRIGQELHDDLSQRVVALSMRLSFLAKAHGKRNQKLADDLDGMHEQAKNICMDMARLSHRLRPTMLDRLGLPVGLRCLCEQSTSAEQIVRFVQMKESPTIAEDASGSLYRIAQEAIRNAVTHSGASHIYVELGGSKTTVNLTVRDNGRGFIVGSTAMTGLGLSGMAERMRNIGGSLSIVSGPGKGTTIHATVPILKAAAAAI